jgi:hypothetical protein
MASTKEAQTGFSYDLLIAGLKVDRCACNPLIPGVATPEFGLGAWAKVDEAAHETLKLVLPQDDLADVAVAACVDVVALVARPAAGVADD